MIGGYFSDMIVAADGRKRFGRAIFVVVGHVSRRSRSLACLRSHADATSIKEQVQSGLEAFHALSSAFISKGDSGRWEPNYSNIGGDLAAGALSNIYYPRSNRGAGILFENALITSSGRMVNGLAQEFLLRRFTPSARARGQ